MALAPQQILFLCGFGVQGDIGPWTTYTATNRGPHGKVIFLKSWLKDPTSPRQKVHRDRVRAAAAAWQTLTPTAKKNWERVTLKLSLPLTGYNLFTHWHMVGDDSNIETLERQSGIQLLPL